jgi:peptide/nickel transport system permease protein
VSVDASTPLGPPLQRASARLDGVVSRDRRFARIAHHTFPALLGLVVLATIAVHVLGIGSPTDAHLEDTLAPPSLAHLFGTDDLGRDVFLRTIYGTLTDLQIGAIATVLPAIVGLTLGSLSGYFGGWVDAVLVRIVDFMMAFPLMVLVICVVAVIGPGLTGVFIALVVKGIPVYLRLARGQMLLLREQQFILCARTLGFSHLRVLLNHALVHVLRPVIVYAIFDLMGNILLLAALSYLGLGVQPPGAEWGAIMAAGQSYLLTAWWIVTLPGLFVVFVGVCVSVTGEAVAERLRQAGAA